MHSIDTPLKSQVTGQTRQTGAAANGDKGSRMGFYNASGWSVYHKRYPITTSPKSEEKPESPKERKKENAEARSVDYGVWDWCGSFVTKRSFAGLLFIPHSVKAGDESLGEIRHRSVGN